MDQSFDPYHKWLGIAKQHQPANHYRLLGIDLFEADVEVIDVAASQRMSYLQDLAAGPRVDLSQKLLNEISAARRCLLNSETKAEYDEQLEIQISAAETADNSPFDFAQGTEAASVRVRRGKKKPTAHTGLFPDSKQKPCLPPPLPDKLPTAHPLGVSVSLKVWVIAVIGSISLITLIIIAVGAFINRNPLEPQNNMAILRIKWKLDERQGAHVMIDDRVVINSTTMKLKNEEIVEFTVEPGEHRFIFEREGCRDIKCRYKLLPGEKKSLELAWRRHR